MTNVTVDTTSQLDLELLETDKRFFMRLLIGAGLAAAAMVGAGVVWHESDMAGGSPPPSPPALHTPAPSAD